VKEDLRSQARNAEFILQPKAISPYGIFAIGVVLKGQYDIKQKTPRGVSYKVLEEA
jgi:hypothetical protein